jgi:biotin synthase
VPPLISQDEALRIGRIEDHDDIEALVERAWRVRLERFGQNAARQHDNGVNPRPDNRSGRLSGETPRTPLDDLVDSQEEANFWNPAPQLRHRTKASVPARPDGAPNA